jgi:hypothetical protein
MWTIATLCLVLASGCVGPFVAWDPNYSFSENMRGCVSERCPDNDAAADHSAQELAKLAIEAARRSDCTCAFALENATIPKDPEVHTQLLHDPAIHPCFDPEVRRAAWPEATRAGTLKRCLDQTVRVHA